MCRFSWKLFGIICLLVYRRQDKECQTVSPKDIKGNKMKEKPIIKLGLIFFSLIIITTIIAIFIWYKNIYNSDLDFCLDTGICKEGIEINTEYGKVKINKSNCIKYNWQWDNKNETCKLN